MNTSEPEDSITLFDNRWVDSRKHVFLLADLYNCVKRQIKCPECRTEHHCADPENFPTNLTLVRFMEVHIEAYGGDPGDVMTGPPQMQKCQVSSARANPIRILHLRTYHLLMPTYIN